jgi:23S rRNA (guanosine2251-2'-O)-methyltransferase
LSHGQLLELEICLLDLRDLGYWSIALTPHADQSLFALEMPERPVLVLGGESGIRPLVEQTCDLRAAIPLRAGVESLNASVAGGIMLFEVVRQRQ